MSLKNTSNTIVLSFLFLLCFILPAQSAQKSSENFEINVDMLGVTGSVGASGPKNGTRLNQSLGVFYTSNEMSSPSGLKILGGLWGGNSHFLGKSCENVVYFGDPRFPARLWVAAGAIPSDWVLFVSTSPTTNPLAVSPAIVVNANQNLAKTLTRYTKPLDDCLWEILVLDSDGFRYNALMLSSATLSLPYRDDNNDGFVDGSAPPVRADKLSLWWLDEAHHLWVKLPGSQVDKTQKMVTAPIRHFSVYAVMGAPSFNPGDIYAFPVPWRPHGPSGGGGAGQTGTLSDGILFTNLPSEAKIRIYTLAGTLVKEINHTDGTAQLSWDVKNDDSEEVQSGTYIWVVESGGNRKSGKLVIIR